MAGKKLTQAEISELKIFAAEIRKATIQAMTAAGAGHVGGAMSMVELLSVLYGKYMNVDPANPRMENRDRLALSKGHSGPALYAALALKGFFPKEHLLTMSQGDTILPSHCDRNKTPGVDFSSGSLGNGLSMAAGAALAAQYLNKPYYGYGIVGDGECNEGQIWEAVLFAAQHKLDHLVAFIDCNKSQLDGPTDVICALGNMEAKFNEFGWYTQAVDGHDVEAIYTAIAEAQEVKGKPKAILLNTVKGYGCAYAMSKENCHHLPFTKEICDAEMERLDAEIEALKKEGMQECGK